MSRSSLLRYVDNSSSTVKQNKRRQRMGEGWRADLIITLLFKQDRDRSCNIASVDYSSITYASKLKGRREKKKDFFFVKTTENWLSRQNAFWRPATPRSFPAAALFPGRQVGSQFDDSIRAERQHTSPGADQQHPIGWLYYSTSCCHNLFLVTTSFFGLPSTHVLWHSTGKSLKLQKFTNSRVVDCLHLSMLCVCVT